MKRQSTVAKLSKTMLKSLIEFCRKYRCGVILRFSGFEFGLTATQLQDTLDQWQALATNNATWNPCIRKSWDSLSQLGFESVLSDASHYSYNPLATTAQLLDWVSIEA